MCSHKKQWVELEGVGSHNTAEQWVELEEDQWVELEEEKWVGSEDVWVELEEERWSEGEGGSHTDTAPHQRPEKVEPHTAHHHIRA